jgi:hypothetical protein
MKLVVVGALSLFFLASTPVLAQPDIRTERVQFKKGETGATIKGHIKGYEIVDYVLGARAGQSLIVILNTDNSMSYFNVMVPGKESALFVGSTSGSRFEGDLPKSGDYRVRVYLVRAAARRNERANYRLEIGIAGDGSASTTPPSPDYADGMAGGPDYWQVTGVPSGDTLNLRTGPSTRDAVVMEFLNGVKLRNLGCRLSGGQKWCRVERPEDPSVRGWLVGRYLREASTP